ncbi:hypothetical protein ColLi_07596 [Colletotrichum liriopes]|uniref:Uncharacterized protein n=1 Tax=Colletotrichum liriopes TaxID=708192 RepID=A0AA37GR99_9PEZI|nr:hypothetical protein ColLi_07596 [Colletotrichum liriopes]
MSLWFVTKKLVEILGRDQVGYTAAASQTALRAAWYNARSEATAVKKVGHADGRRLQQCTKKNNSYAD